MKTPRPTPSPAGPAPPPRRARKARVLLVDDHPLFLQGVTALLTPQPDLTVCGQAGNAADALRAAATLQPDLVLADVSLDGSHGIDLLKDLTAAHPGLPMIMLSMHDETLYAESALRAGAKGYVMKRLPPDHLLDAIRRVLRGGLAFSQAVTARLLHAATGQSEKSGLPTDRLSDRERQILEMIGQGLATRKIAGQLRISIKTVQAHREHLKEKLGLEDGLSLTRFAVHWVESDERVS